MRNRWPVVALSLAIMVLGGIYGCSNDNNKTTNPAPALTATITANPANPTTGSVVHLTVTPSPAGIYTVTWSADGGKFSRTDSTSTTWTAPDLDGTYQVTALIGDGTKSAAAKKPIVVASYVPTASPYFVGAKTCSGCHEHDAKYGAWSGTLHAQAMKALGADSTNVACLGCHTVGYDTGVANGGYDEQAVPRLSGVQCENCHGPASAHVLAGGGPTGINVDKSAALCGGCHDGEHHPTYTEWKGSPHARLVYEGPGETPAASGSCAKCHNGTFSMEYLDDPAGFQNPTDEEAAADTSLTVACAVCHDPHGNNNATPHQLRMASVSDVALPDGTTPEIGAGRLCISCHNGRRAPGSIAGQINNGNAHFGPHHSCQGDMLAGVDGYNNVNPDFHYATGRHVTIQDGCINCHNHHRQDQLPFYTGHDFAPTPQACAFCHGPISDFNDIQAKEDYDGNGVVQGIQTEVEGLMDTLATVIIDHSRDDTRKQELQAAFDGGTFEVAVGDSSISSKPQRAAGYNYFFVKWDGSSGVHNSTYAIQLLQQSILSLRPTGLRRAKLLVK